jgi:peptide/nickel transport system substrate-binding protein
VTLRLTRPNHRLAADFTTYKLLPRHAWEQVADPLRDPAPGQNVGCGPFVIESVDLRRGLIRFARNASWPGPEPRIDEIEIHLFRNRDVLTLALEKDEIDIPFDYADSFPYANLDRVLRDPGITLLESPGAGLFFLGFNLKKPPMSDLRFREAAAAALDFREILRLFLLGYGRVPDRGLIPDTLPFHHPEARLERDLRRAGKLLEEIGLRDRDGDGIREDGNGRPAEFTLLTAPERLRLAELVRAQMKEAGLALIIKSVDGASWVALKDEYRYDLILAKTSPWGLASHAGWGTAYFDARRSGEGVLHTVDDPAFLQLCDALLATGDEAARAALARKVREDYARRLPAVALCWNTIVVPHRRRFTGWTWDPLYGFFNLETFITVRRTDR